MEARLREWAQLAAQIGGELGELTAESAAAQVKGITDAAISPQAVPAHAADHGATPETDALLLELNEGRVYAHNGPIADYARKLECERNKFREMAYDEMSVRLDIQRERDAARARVAELESAGDALLRAWRIEYYPGWGEQFVPVITEFRDTLARGKP
jgi:hypothetical protein